MPHKDPEVARRWRVGWLKKNKTQHREYQRKYAKENPFHNKIRHRDDHRRLRREILRHYSCSEKPFCACCGTDIEQFLSLDHENGDGNKHRLEVGGNVHSTIYHWIKKNGFPEGFQILCHNCNLAKGFYGRCPHMKEKDIGYITLRGKDAAEFLDKKVGTAIKGVLHGYIKQISMETSYPVEVSSKESKKNSPTERVEICVTSISTDGATRKGI